MIISRATNMNMYDIEYSTENKVLIWVSDAENIPPKHDTETDTKNYRQDRFLVLPTRPCFYRRVGVLPIPTIFDCWLFLIFADVLKDGSSSPRDPYIVNFRDG
ncbi:hypothetical protein K1719_010961 [Acacia pycnantha]|nr:hypothetical protein K1719_010961 [Acacia pycnantha]